MNGTPRIAGHFTLRTEKAPVNMNLLLVDKRLRGCVARKFRLIYPGSHPL
jgi:hypothetical protein